MAKTKNEGLSSKIVGLAEGSKGKRVDEVQSYLARFGYLDHVDGDDASDVAETTDEAERDPFSEGEVFVDEVPEGFTPDGNRVADRSTFDGATTTALLDFQSFVGLEPTGEIDEATREAMNQPRCGNPDRSLMSEFVTGVGKWSTTNLTYSFQEYSPDIPSSTQRWAIDQAFGLWSAETPLRFRRVADGTGGDIVIRFVAGNHGDGASFDGTGRVLAHAFFPSNSGPIRGDSHFDEAESWTLNVPTGPGIDLVTVAAHEFGHALGLRHSSDRAAMMFPSYSGPRRHLAPDDIAGIQSLYGGPGTLENATWIHGNAAVIEFPGQVDFQRHYGFFNRVIGKANSTNWIHFSLPTPVIEDRVRLDYDRFMLRAVSGNKAVLRDVHIRDGERVIALHNQVNRRGAMGFEKFGVASMPPVRWGASISLGFDFGSGSTADRRVDLISAGMDYKR